MLQWALMVLAAFLIFYSVNLIIVSFVISSDRRIALAQRGIAFLCTVGAVFLIGAT